MLKATLLLLLAALVAEPAQGFSFTNSLMRTFGGFDEHCPYTRQDAIKCFAKYVDENKDGVIEESEVEGVQKKLSWYVKLIAWVTGWRPDVSTKVVMRDCGGDKDGKITAEAFMKASKTCMPSRWALCAVKMVCDHLDKGEDPAKALPARKKHSNWFNW